MTYRNQLWKRASESTEARCIGMLRRIFPSMAYDFIPTESGMARIDVTTKDGALKKFRLGLNKITEIEASYYISLLDQKRKTSQIKF